MLIIGGATATGKSGLAIKLAKKLNGEVVSADSMQIYKHMNIGTAKVTEQEKEGITHHIIDIIEPEQTFSVAQYAKLAKQTIADIKLRKKVPVVVGGTGLYINSLIYDYNLSAQDLDLRSELQKELETFGKEYMHNKLASLCPDLSTNIHCNNTKRVLRALEVFLLTGKSITDKQDKKQALPHKMYAINLDRQIMYDKINTRVEQMFCEGLLNELEYLVNIKKLSFDAQSMQAIGYKEFREYYFGNKNIEEVKEEIKKDTRNYAKRQMTWFRSIPTCNWLQSGNNYQILDIICNEYSKYSTNLE